MRTLSSAEQLLQELGVTDPQDIDIEAIAWHLGAIVKARPLAACEARIIGHKDRAIITVNEASTRSRQRFSIGHELGHWQHHRGQSLLCSADEIGNHDPRAAQNERTADGYASDLLLPRYLLDPLMKAYSQLNFDVVRDISKLFDTSMTATAFRLVSLGYIPSILICHGYRGRRWFRPSPNLPSRWFPRDEVDPSSLALDVLFGRKPPYRPMRVRASAWFDRREAEQYQVWEHTMRVAEEEALTLLTITDPNMLKNV